MSIEFILICLALSTLLFGAIFFGYTKSKKKKLPFLACLGARFLVSLVSVVAYLML